jgi:hypothetical protein
VRKRRKRRWQLLAIVACLAIVAAVAVWRWGGSPGAVEVDARRCTEGPITPGIDVSYYQEAIRWPRVHAAGIRFAFIRVSDGTSMPDPRFAANWQGARDAHVMRGAYQYFRPDVSATAQADLLIAAISRDRG